MTTPPPPAGPGPQSVADVVRRMEQIDSRLPHADGVRWFDHLYLEVTRSVAAAMGEPTFRDPAFMERLDLVFAGYYFRAVDAASGGGAPVSSAWAPLFQNRGNHAVAPLQFALCGMNAHINNDLPAALVDAYGAAGGPGSVAGPERDTDRYRDYASVNDILARVETRVRQDFETGLGGLIGRVFPGAADRVAHWSIVDAREAAWSSAQVLWSLRSGPAARDAYLETLGHLVGFAGRGLLIAP